MAVRITQTFCSGVKRVHIASRLAFARTASISWRTSGTFISEAFGRKEINRADQHELDDEQQRTQPRRDVDCAILSSEANHSRKALGITQALAKTPAHVVAGHDMVCDRDESITRNAILPVAFANVDEVKDVSLRAGDPPQRKPDLKTAAEHRRMRRTGVG